MVKTWNTVHNPPPAPLLPPPPNIVVTPHTYDIIMYCIILYRFYGIALTGMVVYLLHWNIRIALCIVLSNCSGRRERSPFFFYPIYDSLYFSKFWKNFDQTKKIYSVSTLASIMSTWKQDYQSSQVIRGFFPLRRYFASMAFLNSFNFEGGKNPSWLKSARRIGSNW